MAYKTQKREKRLTHLAALGADTMKEGVLKVRTSLKTWTPFWCQVKPGFMVIYKEKRQCVAAAGARGCWARG